MKKDLKISISILILSIVLFIVTVTYSEKQIKIQQKNIALDFCNYCYEHEIIVPNTIDYEKFEIMYGPKGIFPNYYKGHRK